MLACRLPLRVGVRHHQRSRTLLEERLAESPLVTALRDELASLQRDRTIFALAP
jgi:hypothetical protein